MPEVSQVMATVVKTIRTECGQYEARIEQRNEDVFAIELFKWTVEWVEGYGNLGEFWERITRMATFTDTPETAEKLAAEDLRMYGTVHEKSDKSEAT